MDFEKICTMFTMQEPYYGIILSSMERVPMPASRIKTEAVTRSGNVFRFIYNPDFIASLDVPTTLETLKHEILHLAFSHFTLWKPTKSRGEQHLRNLAADLEVNSYINENNVHNLELFYPHTFNWEKGLGTKEYYRLLRKLLDEQTAKASKRVQKPCNDGVGQEEDDENEGCQQDQTEAQSQSQSSQQDPSEDNANDDISDEDWNESKEDEDETTPTSNSMLDDELSEDDSDSNGHGKSGDNGDLGNEDEDDIPDDALEDIEEFDDHSMWPDEEEDRETANQIIEDMLVAAAEEVEKNHGTVPGELIERIGEIRNRRKPKPVADWKRYVRRYLGNEFSEFIRKSKKRESRRFPDAAGNRHRRKSNILVAIDTSASVSLPEYYEFFGQIRTLTSVADFDVVECDTRIANKYHFSGTPRTEIHGGGGTSFQPVIDHYLENRKKYDALIYFTDGECNVPGDTPKDTLWVISSHGDKRRASEFRVNGASVVFIPKKD